MKNKIGYIFLIVILFFLTAGTSVKPLYEMSDEEINTVLQELHTQKKNVISKIEFFSEIAKDTPYQLGVLGQGAEGKYDKDPLINFKSVDCMTFCEQILALSISSTYDEAFNNLQKIRYKNGKKGLETRNHHVVADWLPNNSWFLEDATMEVGVMFCKETTKIISHKKLFESQGYKNVPNVQPDRKITTKYIPKDKLIDIEKNLKSGDIGLFITDKPGIFTTHMGLIIKSNNNTVFRNASSIDKKVIDLPFNDLVKYLGTKKNNIGMKFLRVQNSWIYSKS